MSKTRMGKRVASLLLSLVMMLSLLPTTVYATGGTGETNGANVEATNTSDDNTVGGTTGNPELTGEGEGGDNVSEGETANVATIGEAKYETLDAAIEAVADGQTIVVNAGEYKLNGNLSYTGKAFTIAAAEGADVSFDMSAAVALHGAKITFNNVTFDYKTNGNYIGLQHTDTLVYNNCTINGVVFLYAVNETFNSCKFYQDSADAYNVWTYGAQNVAFNGCTFNCVGRCVLVYNEGAIDKTDLTVENTEFNASAPAEGKAAIEIDTSLMEGGATITVDDKTTAAGFAAGSKSGSTLWNDKKQTADTNKNTTVTVAGETVFEPKATASAVATTKDGREYATLTEALAAVTESNPLTSVTEEAWPAATPVYYDGNFYATIGELLYGAQQNTGVIAPENAPDTAVIYCRPGTTIPTGKASHPSFVTSTTIYGNGAKLSGSTEWDVENYFTLTKDITINLYSLNGGASVWGTRRSDFTVTVNMVDCKDAHEVLFNYGSGNGRVDVTVKDSTFLKSGGAAHGWPVSINCLGSLLVDGCTFDGVTTGVVVNVKQPSENGKMDVTVKNSTFNDVTGQDSNKGALRVTGQQACDIDLTIENVAFTGTHADPEDITIGNVKSEENLGKVSYNISGTDASMTTHKAGATEATKETLVSGTTYTGTNAATAVGDGTEANPYTLAQLGVMTRQEYIDAQERLNGTMYVTVGDYTYGTNGVLGNGTASNSDKDSTKMNYYGAPGAKSGQYSDAAVGKSVVFVGGSITSNATGYVSIDNIGTSLLLALPAYTKVTFKDTTFNNVMSFNYQLYTSPWSQLGELKFDGCTFNGIIVGAIAAQTLTFNRCEFTNYTNTTAPNSSNPTWIRPAYGNWAQSDNEGQGSDFRSLTTINFTNNTVTSTRPVKFEYISQWDITSTVTATGNFFDISSQAGDTAIKNVGLYLGAHTDANAFNLVAENNTKSANTAALYTIPEGETSLPLGSTVKNLAGEPVELTDALKWKAGDAATDKIVLKTEEAVASVGGKQYSSLQEAIDAAANNGDTVTLLANVDENVEIAKEKNLTLDLNGCTLNGGTGTDKAALSNLGTITIRDTSADKAGTIKRDDNGTVGETSYYVIRNQGTMTIESGNVINNSGYKKANSTGSMVGSSLICNGDCDEGGTLTIKGGTFTQKNFIAIKNGALGVLHVTGGTISSDHSAIQNWFEADITGGEIKGQLWTDAWKEGESVGETKIGGNAEFTGEIVMDITGSVVPTLAITGGNLSVTNWRITTAAAKAGAKPAVSGGTFTSAVPEAYCAAGFIPTANADGTYGVKAGAYVAQIGDVKYETLQAAIDAVKAGETIYVLGNIDLGTDELSTYKVKTTVKNVTIDLGGYTVTSAGKYTVYLKVNGWTIQNGTIQNTNASTTYGTLYIGGSSNSTTLKNLTVESETNGVQFAIASSKNGIKASITVEDGTKISGKYGVYMKGQPKPWSSTRDGQEILNVNGGEITGTTAAIAVFGAAKGNTKAGVIVNINGGKVYSDSYAIAGNGSSVLENTTINISGGKVFSNKDTAIYHPQAGTVTISGGEVYGVTGGVQMCAGTLNVTGGTISATGNGDVSGKTGDGSIPDGAAVSIVNRAYPAGAPTMTISGGTFTSAAGVGAVQAYGWKNDSQQTWDKPNASVSGGTFSSAVKEEYCATGYIPTANADGTFGVKEGVYVAKVNNVKYETLQAAINAAKRNATVTMLANTRENVTISTPYLTLDLNGFTLNGGTEKGKPALTVTARVTVKDSSTAQTGTIMREDTAENSGVSSHYVIDVQGNGWLTFESGIVKNNSGNANGKGASLVRVGDDRVAKYPGLNIKGGTFTQDNFIVIKVDRGDLFLNGGSLNSKNSYAIEDWHRATIKGGTVNGTVAAWTYSGGYSSSLEISGGTINGDVTSVNYGNADGKKATVAITGGTINGELDTRSYDPKTNKLTSISDATKATIEVTAGTFAKDPTKYLVEGSTVKTNSDGTFGVEKAYLATVGETSYYTMEEAFKAQTASGKPIVMLRDYTTGSPFNSGTINRTVDLNGYTWTCTGTDTNSAAFEINNPDVTLTVKNGEVVSSQLVGLIPSAMGGTIKYDNAGLVFEDVVMTTTAHSGIETNGNNTNDAVTLKNSTLNVPDGFGIYFPSSGTLTIDNSTINAKTMGVQVCAGSLSINAGSAITVIGDAVPKTENDGAIQDGAAISIVNRTGYKGLGDVTVTGGKFTAKAGNKAIKAYDWANKTETEFTAAEKVAVSGGTFSSAVKEEYCATGYIPVANDDGTHTVKEGVYVAKVDNVKYETLQAAIDAANAGDTVKLLRDINTPEISYMISKSLTIDLNGMTVTGSGYDAVFQIDNADAKVVIKNGKVVAVEQSGSAGKYTMAIWASKAGCEVTLEGLDVSQKITHTDDPQMDMIYASGGTITINSGNFVSGTPEWTLNCNDTSYKNGTAKIIVKGGTFVGFDPANNKAEGKGTNFVAAGYVSTMGADGNYTVEEYKPVEVWTGYSGAKVASYATVAEAAEKLDGNKWIVIGKDYTLTENFTIGGENLDNLYLDVAEGATLTVAEGVTLTVAANAKRLGVRDGATLVNKGTIVVCGSSTSNGFAMLYGTFTGNELTVPEGCFLDNNGKNFFATANENAVYEITFGDGTVKKTADSTNIKGGNVKQIKLLKDVTNGGWTLDSSSVGAEVVLDLNGHTISYNGANRYYATLNVYTKVTIKNGTVKYEGSKRGAIDLVGQGDLTIERDVTIDGGDGFAIFTSGTSKLTVNGKVTANGNYAIAGNGSKDAGGYIDSCDIIVNGGAVISASKGIAIYHPEKGTVTINGGTITGHTGIEMCAGQLVVNGGSITSNGDNMDATGSQNAILDGAAISIINRNYPGGVPTAVIKGGTFAANGKDAQTVKAYDYTGDKVAEWTAAGDNVNISGGTFSSIPTNMGVLCADGYKTVYDAYADMYNVVKQDAKITVGKRLSIGNDLTITYLVSLTDCTNPWVKFQFYNDDIKGYTTVEVKNYGTDTVTGPDGKPMDVFTFDFTGINPQRMTDTLKATVYAKDANGNVVEYQVDDYSVAQYCSNKLAKLGQDDSLRKLIGNLVAYGAAAQVYQNYRTDNLVSTVVSGAVSTDYTDRLSSVTQYTGKVTGAAGVTIKGKTLVLSNTFAVRVYFTVNEGVDIANVSFNVTANGKTDTVNSFEKDEKLGYYYFDYANLNATQLDSEVKFESFVNETGVGDMVTYSVNTYLAKKMPNYDKSSNAYKLMAELFNYGCACTEYASK